jgi:hypothetical protein
MCTILIHAAPGGPRRTFTGEGVQMLVTEEMVAGGLVAEALRRQRQKGVVLVGYLELNQGLPTFTGRMSLEQFCDLTVVHNRKWAEEAGESLDIVTQREIIDAHANGLATFMLQGLTAATIARAKEAGYPQSQIDRLEAIQDRVGKSEHYGLPQVTLVLPGEPDNVESVEVASETVAARLTLPTGKLFVVADGQHRREGARRVRDFLIEVNSTRRTPKSSKIYPAQDAPIGMEEAEAWVSIYETFRAWSYISYEAHLGLSVSQARQMFTNYNCHVKPVKQDLNLEFDQSNPINRFGKAWLHPQIEAATDGKSPLDLRQLASINGFLFLGKTSIKSAPFDIGGLEARAKEFWTYVLQTPEWKREGSLLREVPVLKGLAKAWFYVFTAKRNSRLAKAEMLRAYIRKTKFDGEWMESVPGLVVHTVPTEDGGFRFSPAHNDIVSLIVAHAFGEN